VDKNFAVGNFTGIINGAHPRISKVTQSILKYATEVTNLKNKQQEQHRSATNNVHNTLYMYVLHSKIVNFLCHKQFAGDFLNSPTGVISRSVV
jgi:hypothetical protein